MKILDKFLKLLKTDRNTFFTYVFEMITFYLIIDRLIEFLLIVFTGVASVYWGPIRYAIALVFPVFTFLFSMSSKFIKSDDDKLHWFYMYCIELYIFIIVMITEWINKLCWIGIISLPGYTTIVSEFAYLIKPAFSSMAIALPLCTWYLLFDKLYKVVNDTKLYKDSIFDYDGINLADTSIGWGPYTNEIFIGTDKDHGNDIKLPEIRRFESTLVVGISGAGKTSMIFEPWVAQDINKKFFFKESSKTLAFAALKTGIASLNAPYDNDYINKNFNLNMLVPNESKLPLFKAYFKKLILADTGSKIIYKNLGITYMSPDYETIEKIQKVCDNFGMSYNIIDPTNPDSIGLNPFAHEDPIHASMAISQILRCFFMDRHTPEEAQTYKTNLSIQIIENLSLLLKIVYPKLNDGKLPNLDDLLKLLNNFELIEKMCKIIEKDSVLSAQYEHQINYFKKNFYKDSPNREEMNKAVALPMSQLDTLLRFPGVRSILCNRTRNLNFDNALENGDINLVCTRRGDIGEKASSAFGLFYLLLMQYSVLRRPGNENSRIPHFMYIDEFPDFICKSTESIFTIYRKYRVATVVSAQNLAQIRTYNRKLGDTIIANCANKIVFGNNTPEDNEWWSQEIGEKKEWTIEKNSYNFAEDKYESKGSANYGNKIKYQPGKVQALSFKKCMFKIRDLKGKIVNGTAKLDFLPPKFKEKQKIKSYNFSKYSSGIAQEKPSNFSFTNPTKSFNNKISNGMQENGPIKLDTSNLNFDLNNDDAIVFNLDNKNKKNN